MAAMGAPTDLGRAFKPLNNRRMGMGCLTMLLVWAVIGVALWLTLPPAKPQPPLDELRPVRAGLVVIAAGGFMVAVMSLWGLVVPYRPINPASGLPRVARRGRVVADGEPLRAPLSGTPCVAYRYTLSLRRHLGEADWDNLWIYVGAGSMAWSLAGADGPPLTVRTVTLIADDAQRLEGPATLARARQLVAWTPFEARAGAAGGIGLSVALLADMKDVEVPEGRPYRRDWFNSQEGKVGLQDLQWRETVLPVGADVTVVGHLRDGTAFVVPPEALEPVRAAATAEGRLAMDVGPDELVPAGDAPQRASVGQVLAAVVIFGGLGGLLLALARHI